MDTETIINTEQPHPARIYDYFLGGACNFAADRAFAEQIIAAVPGVPLAARINRGFLRRVVRYAVGRGITQFLDLGSGIPTAGNTHEVAPGAHVVYVDNDAVAVAHSREILRDVPTADIVGADLTDPAAVLGAPQTLRLLDFDKPVCVLALAVFHFIEDGEPVAAPYRDVLAPGSLLAVSHGTRDAGAANGEHAERMYRHNGTPGVHRSKDDMAALFGPLHLVEPGIVWTSLWRPEDEGTEDPTASLAYAAVGEVR